MRKSFVPLLAMMATVLATTGLFFVISSWRSQALQATEARAVQQLAVLPSHTQWNTLRGIRISLSEAVRAVTWSFDGRMHRTLLAQPEANVWLSTPLQQAAAVDVRVISVETVYGQNARESWQLRGRTATPLQATTDPGTWQLDVDRNGPFSVDFSAAIVNPRDAAQDITFRPAIAGVWRWSTANTAVFYPKGTLPPTQEETMAIVGGRHGLHGTDGQYLPVQLVQRPFITASNEQIVVSEKVPETLTLLKHGKSIFTSLCNTGITGAHTPVGQFYVRNKFPFVNMHGTDPDGHKYSAPHVPWVMPLVGNIAIHGYPRQQYGFPQSVGCVELPIAAANKLYHLVQVGTPVTIVV